MTLVRDNSSATIPTFPDSNMNQMVPLIIGLLIDIKIKGLKQ